MSTNTRAHEPSKPSATGSSPEPADPPERRGRYSVLRLTADEARAVRIAIRKVASAHRGGYVGLAIAIGIPTSTLYAAARPTGRPSPGLAIRLAAIAKVPVEVLLGGKLAVQPPVIGVAAEGRAA
jgi:hypothetical protein